MSEKGTGKTIEVPLVKFAFWQAQMAHASEHATNDPEHNGDAVHRAHNQMREALRSFHADNDTQGDL